MTKCEAISWAAKLTSCIAELPDDAEVHGFGLHLNLDNMKNGCPMVLAVQLCNPINSPAAFKGKQYSGWHEMRVYIEPDVYVWWSEPEEAENG